MPNTDVHPDLRRFARFAPRHMIGRRTLPVIRALTGLTGLRSAPSDVEVLTLPSGVGVRLFRPAGVPGPAPALLWIHGGGYVIGTAQQDDALCRRFSRKLGITVASVDYRLAPEHPYPAPLEDCYSALTWLAGLPAVDPDRVAIGGAQRRAAVWRRRWHCWPATAARSSRHFSCWCTRCSTTGVLALVPPIRTTGCGVRVPISSAGTPTSAMRTQQVAVPARRDDLSGLPPAWIGVGTNDLFHDEDLAYAERLKDAGVPCEVEVVPGAFHGFDLVVAKAQVSQRFFASQCDVLRSALQTVG